MTLLLPHHPDLTEGIGVATTWPTMTHCMPVFYMISSPQPALFIDSHNNLPFTQKKCFAFEKKSVWEAKWIGISKLKMFSPLKDAYQFKSWNRFKSFTHHILKIQHNIEFSHSKKISFFLHYLCQSQHKYLKDSDYHVWTLMIHAWGYFLWYRWLQ